MRVLIVNHFPLEGSGSGTYTRNIASYLAQEGHEVCVILPENTVDHHAPPGVKLHPVYFSYKEAIYGALPFNFPCFTSHPRSVVTFEDLSREQQDAYIHAFERAIEEEVRNFKPDIIHGQHIWILSCLAARTGIPCVITSHGTDLMGYSKIPALRPYADEAVERAAGIITISKDMNEAVLKTFPGSRDKRLLMKNGYDASAFYPEQVSVSEVLRQYDIMDQADYLVLFAGKLTYFKGADVLLQAARIYEDIAPNRIITLMAGDGELALELRELSRKLGLGHAYFLGHVPQYALRKLYSAADVTVMPSRREPFGLVAVEALACGTPVIGTNQGGLPDIITGDVGSLVDVDDPLALSEAVRCELLAAGRAARRERAARYAKENYSQEQNTRRLIGYYGDILNCGE